MKKIHALGLITVGFLTLFFLVLTYSPYSVAAPEPASTPTVTPTPDAGQPAAPRCRLERGVDCDNPDRLGQLPGAMSANAYTQMTNPDIDAQGVPTYTLVSIAFGTPIDPSTLTPDSFYVTQNGARVAGTVSYIDITNMGVFHPATPLLTNTTYTARATRDIRYLGNVPLAQDIVWDFTTAAGNPRLGGLISPAGVAGPGGMNIYFGDLHAHSNYSDGQGTPQEAYAAARARGLDYFGLSDHGLFLTQAEWNSTLDIANAATVNGQFIGLRGFEYTNFKGHINVFNTDSFVSRDDPNYNTLDEFYNWLKNFPEAVGQFNHPAKTPTTDWNFNDFLYYPQLDHQIVLQELTSVPQFFLSLDTGWRLGSTGNTDAHFREWGLRRTGVVATALTKQAILEGLRARRTFFPSPSDVDFSIVMRANGYWMGSSVPNTGQLNFDIFAYDPSPRGKTLRLRLYESGVSVARKTISSRHSYSWTPSTPARLGHYYYVEAYYDGWLYPAYSSPIWVERAPVAEAGQAQLVPVGTTVNLSGQASWDPDQDALVYRWTQQSGPPVSLSSAIAAQPSFTAPAAPGDVILTLTVTDPGGLSASDSIAVTVTDKPILKIVKQGPTETAPGEAITYILEVSNLGASPAAGVVITDRVPSGATYLSGGDAVADNVVSWTVSSIPPNQTAQVSFSVTANQAIANYDYGATCADCFAAKGETPIFTNGREYYLPVVRHRR